MGIGVGWEGRSLRMEDASSSITVSPKLQQILREYTKAVLRDRPTDVLTYSHQYFVEKCDTMRMEAYALPPSDSEVFLSLPVEYQLQIEDLFKRYDTDCDMSISVSELREMMQSVPSFMGFDGGETDVQSIMAIFDADADSRISWQEWSHSCAEYVRPYLDGVPPYRDEE